MTEQNLPRLYSLTQIGIATFLGSALAAGYMLAKNYTALGQPRLGLYAAWGSIAVVALFMLVPADVITSPGLAVVVMVGQVVVVLLVANQLQGKMLTSFHEMGGQYHTMLRTVGVGVAASFVLTFAYVLLILLFGGPLPEAPAG